MPETPVDQLVQAQQALGQLVAAVQPEQWQSPTPCTGWTVHDLVSHLVGGSRLFAGALQGTGADPGRLAADQLGDDPLAAYRDAAGALVEAFRQPGALERTVTVPAGSVPGIAALHLRLVETLVHGWDLARATGQPAHFPEQLVEAELAFTRRQLASLPESTLRRRPFASPQPAPDDAPALDRLAALLGRPLTDG